MFRWNSLSFQASLHPYNRRLNSTMFRWNSFIFLPPPWRWGRLNSTMFRWNLFSGTSLGWFQSYCLNSTMFRWNEADWDGNPLPVSCLNSTMFRWKILKRVLMKRNLLMFKFHYVQMKHANMARWIRIAVVVFKFHYVQMKQKYLYQALKTYHLV